MKRNAIIAVLIAVLLCPLIAISGSCESDAGEKPPTTMLDFDETKINVYDYKNAKLSSGDTIELGDAITIEPIKEKVRITINGEVTDKVGVKFGVPSRFFEKDVLSIKSYNLCSILFEFIDNKACLGVPNAIDNVSITDQITLPNIDYSGVLLKEWYVIVAGEKHSFLPGDLTIDEEFMSLFEDESTTLTLSGLLEYTTYCVTLMTNGGAIDDSSWLINDDGDYVHNYDRISSDVVLPSATYYWYDFIGWINDKGESFDTVKADTCSNVILFADQKLKNFKIDFYLNQNANELFESKLLTKDNYQTPVIPSNDYVDEWYYTDQSGVEHEFKNGVLLQNDMKVYTKYREFNVRFHEKDSITTLKLSKDHFEVPHCSDENFIGWFYIDQNNEEREFKEGVSLQDNMTVYANYNEASNNTNDSGSKDTSFYSLLTENGIKITDNEVVETVTASVIFVMLALATFILVFRRY